MNYESCGGCCNTRKYYYFCYHQPQFRIRTCFYLFSLVHLQSISLFAYRRFLNHLPLNGVVVAIAAFQDFFFCIAPHNHLTVILSVVSTKCHVRFALCFQCAISLMFRGLYIGSLLFSVRFLWYYFNSCIRLNRFATVWCVCGQLFHTYNLEPGISIECESKICVRPWCKFFTMPIWMQHENWSRNVFFMWI